MRRLRRSFFLALLLIFSVFGVILYGGLLSYSALSKETLIAELSFTPREGGGFDALLKTGDRCKATRHIIYGDQWRIDAHFLKWKYWANVLGVDSRYRLERLQGRYRTAAAENSERISAHDLNSHAGNELGPLAAWLDPMNLLFDTSYGSSTYQSIDPDRVYRIYRTQTGIMSRSEPLLSPMLAGDFLDIEIDKACGTQPGRLSRLLGLAN